VGQHERTTARPRKKACHSTDNGEDVFTVRTFEEREDGKRIWWLLDVSVTASFACLVDVDTDVPRECTIFCWMCRDFGRAVPPHMGIPISKVASLVFREI
jgi:hypothetical protein